jgi:hypothetical protein
MSPNVIFCITIAVFLLVVIYLDVKYGLLRDISIVANRKPYSFARVQLTWWTVIILSSFITILISYGAAPTFYESTLILLGISAATTTAARIIDRSDQPTIQSNPPKPIRIQDQSSEGFLLDILSDGGGVSIHRFQTVIFNLAFGIWFICTVFYYLKNYPGNINLIMPDITQNNLILLGISSATYAVLKTDENK